jgi:membrane protease subunit (stomatin/prohibitin family)
MIRRAGFGRPVRAGRPGLIGTAARTAVVAGTASAVAGGVNRRQENRAAEQQQAAQYQQQAAQPLGQSDNDRLAKLQQLGDLRDQGVLTDQEFEAEKARLLAS